MKKERLYNLELLRILSMSLVMLLHYNIPINGQPNLFSLKQSTLSVFSVFEVQSLSIVCVNCFILISGYFGIRWKWRSILNFLFQVLFWVVFSYLFACACSYQTFTGKDFVMNLLHFLSYNWFIVSYLGLYMFAPVLNKFIEQSSKRELVIFTSVFYVFQTIFGYILQDAPEFNQGMSFVSLIGLYLLGACIRNVETKIFRWNKYIDLGLYIGLGLFLAIISMLALYLNINKSLYGYMNPIVIAQSVYLFLFFTKIEIHSKWVIFFSSSAFSIYLFHYNPNVYPFYLDLCRSIDKFGGISAILLFLPILYTAITLIDKVRKWTFEVCIGRWEM